MSVLIQSTEQARGSESKWLRHTIIMLESIIARYLASATASRVRKSCIMTQDGKGVLEVVSHIFNKDYRLSPIAPLSSLIYSSKVLYLSKLLAISLLLCVLYLLTPWIRLRLYATPALRSMLMTQNDPNKNWTLTRYSKKSLYERETTKILSYKCQ